MGNKKVKLKKNEILIYKTKRFLTTPKKAQLVVEDSTIDDLEWWEDSAIELNQHYMITQVSESSGVIPAKYNLYVKMIGGQIK